LLSVGLALVLVGCSHGPVRADDVSNPALKQIVSGLVERNITVLAAAVEAESPLRLSVSVSTGSATGDPGYAEMQAEREVAAEGQRDQQLSQVMILAVDTRGRVDSGHGVPLASTHVTELPPSKMTTAAAQQIVSASVTALVRPPLTISSLVLTEDVLGARLLHIKVVDPDFRNTENAYVRTFTDVENRVDDLNQTQGTAVGVQWMEAIDQQGRLLYSSWWDYQLGISTDQPGLVTDFRPRFFPQPSRSFGNASPAGN
jgi:hypothetical protein